ncbi:ATP-binding cassette domain-containing protein [Imbroritus primus]|uniref:ATP-binding cassette domain-containing protein n=1 Tax=Imbroritus primus TaxID=3058603 RepID=UPI003D1619C1
MRTPKAPLSPLKFLSMTLRQLPRGMHASLALAAGLVLLSTAAMMASLEFSRMTLQAVRVDLYQGELDAAIRWILTYLGTPLARASLVLGAATIAVAILAYVIGFLRDCLFDRIALGVVLHVREQAMRQVLGYRYADLIASDAGTINKRIFQDAGMLQRLLVDCLLLRVVDAVLLLSCLGYLFVLQPVVAFLAGLLVAVHAAAAVLSALLVQTHMRQADHASERLWSRLAQLLGRLRMVRATGTETQEMTRLSGELHDETRARRRVGIYLFLDKALTGLLHFSGPVLILLALVLTSGQSTMQIETFVVLVMVLGMMFSAADNLTAVFMDLSRIEVATDNIQALLGIRAEQPGHIAASRSAGPLLAIENLRFRYPGAARGLDIRALAVHPGEKIAILGGSGLGKSTLLELIVGLHDDYTGQLSLGPWTLQHGSSNRTWRAQISYLPAAIELVEGDVYDNLFYGLTKPAHPDSDVDLQAVLRRFGLDALLRTAGSAPSSASAFEAAIGKHQLSTGQIRRIQLVRTLLRGAGARLALLDEPVAPLAAGDRVHAMRDFFDLLEPGTAALVVTHQTDILPLFDRVIMLGELASGEIGIVQTWAPQTAMDAQTHTETDTAMDTAAHMVSHGR